MPERRSSDTTVPPFLVFVRAWWIVIAVIGSGIFTAGGLFWKLDQLGQNVIELAGALDAEEEEQINRDAAQWRQINEDGEKIDNMIADYNAFKIEVRGSVNPANIQAWGAILRDVEELKKDVREMRNKTRGLKIAPKR